MKEHAPRGGGIRPQESGSKQREAMPGPTLGSNPFQPEGAATREFTPNRPKPSVPHCPYMLAGVPHPNAPKKPTIQGAGSPQNNPSKSQTAFIVGKTAAMTESQLGRDSRLEGINTNKAVDLKRPSDLLHERPHGEHKGSTMVPSFIQIS